MNIKQKIVALGAILMVILVAGCTSQTQEIDNSEEIEVLETTIDFLEAENKANIEFFKDYSIALVNIHIAIDKLNLANINYNKFDEYIREDEYYYDIAEGYLIASKEQILEAKELSEKAKIKLDKIKDNAPDSFFQGEIENRIKHNDALMEMLDNFYKTVNYYSKAFYEHNNGSEEKTLEYFEKGDEYTVKVNANIKEFADIQDDIDLYWEQDWYVEFLG